MTGRNFKFSISAYFFISIVLDGLQRSYGLFVLKLLQSSSIDRQRAAMPFAFSWAVANIIASFSDGLIEKKKSECVILFGVLITAIGAALCILSTDVTTLIVSWGFIFGSGYGMASPHLARHLKNIKSPRLSFFSQVTPSFGMMVMPFILHSLTSYYGLQGSYLIIAGIILNYLPLSVAAAFNIQFHLPNIKWRVRKRSRQYVVSKQEKSKIVSDESSVNCLEPEMILKTSQNDECQDEIYSDTDNSALSMDEIFPVGRKRTETRGNDLQGLDMDQRILSRRKTPSIVAIEIQKYENERKLFEGSFRCNDITCNRENKESKGNNSINCDITNNDKILTNNFLNTIAEHDFYLKDELVTLSESSTYKTVIEHTEPEKGLENCSEPIIKDVVHKLAQPETKISQTLNENKNSSTILIKKEFRHSTKEKSRTEKSSLNKNPENSATFCDNKLAKVPFDIKVHVEECTFINDGEQWYQNVDSNYEIATKNSYRSHTNSMVPELYTDIDLTVQKFSNTFQKTSEICKPELSNIYSISEKLELNDKRISGKQNSKETAQNKNMETIPKIKKILHFINEMTSAGCLCIILITIIFEINLVTLIIMFADFGHDINNKCSDFKWILAAFGAGGLVGKFCCWKISRTIPEKSNAIGVVLFLLTGLSTAGVVFSTNLKWLAGFYSMLGALEGGITYTIPKFILEYVDRSMHCTLSSVRSFLSGVAMISIPYAIGLSRDELGDYDFLLQTLSCSSILCAFLVYFLPYLSTSSDKQLTSFSKDKMEIP